MIPLSTRMRPEKLDDFIGQEHFLYKNSLMYNSIENKTFNSAIFFGSPGTGKTTLARIIAKKMDASFHEINASETGIKELKDIFERARLRFFGLEKEKTYLYIDELHRWNKLQQDSLLKALEDGFICFIGSTSENPYFAINKAVLSRVRSIYEFKPLKKEDIKKILANAVKDREKGLGSKDIVLEDGALELIAEMSSGDVRIALDTLGFIANNREEGEAISREIVAEAMQRKSRFYDRKEDKYNLLSALQKSIRGSDPDASIHYLSRLIEGEGEIDVIGRRLLVIASEDIGMAYPQAISIVTSCVQAAQMVGLPEAKIILAQAVILLAASPKSNSSIRAINKALRDLKTKHIDDIPLHLKDSHYQGASERGIGIGYKNPHDHGGYIEQQYLPDNLCEGFGMYYEPTENGREAAFKKYMEGLRGKKY